MSNWWIPLVAVAGIAAIAACARRMFVRAIEEDSAQNAEQRPTRF